MPSRLVRSATAVALASSAITFAYVGSAAPAQAAGSDGYCKTSSGVTVVVDFRGLGGGVTIRCSPVGSGATGVEALQAAGIPLQGTRQYGLGTPCRLYGRPSATETLPGGYHEACVRMPPTKAYWSYWHAPNGGSWTYSSDGAANRSVIPGGFEGWSFSEGSNVAPGVAPSRPAAPTPPTTPTSKPTHTKTTPAPPRHTSTTAPEHDPAPGTSGDGSTASGSGGAAGGSQPKSTAASKTARSKAATSKAAKSKAAKSEAAERKSKSAKATASKHAKTSHSSSSTSSRAATGTSSGVPTDAAGAPIKNSDDMIKDAKKGQSSSINATTVIGGGVLGALAIGGGVVAFIRRRSLGQ